jgi:hypothetical protein
VTRKITGCPELHTVRTGALRCGAIKVTTTGDTKQNAPDSIRVRSVCRSALPQVLLNYRVAPSPLRVNGTGVPDHVTLRPYHHSPLRLNVYPLAAGCFRER